MDLIVQGNALRHIKKMLNRAESAEPFIKFQTEKPLCPCSEPDIMPLPAASPEDVGTDPAYIADFLEELRSDKSLDMHGVVTIREGRVICNTSSGPYKPCFWSAMHSFSKSVTSMAVGMLRDEGRLSLDDRAVSILADRVTPLAQLTHRAITVRHLLTMTSGIAFSEIGAVVEENWLRAFFESRIRTEPGKVFSYNSLNTYVLSCIVHEVSGLTLLEYLNEKLFGPLGITVLNWEKAPDGNEIGGWGLYLRRGDAAKLAQLYLNGGMWEGRQIISSEWIKESVSAKIKVPGNTGNFDYGYHVWTGRDSESFLFNGMFGQDAIVFPKTKTAVISNAGIEQLFQQSRYYDIVTEYFGSPYYAAQPLRKNRRALRKLEAAEASLALGRPYEKIRFAGKRKKLPGFLSEAVGKTFSVRKKDEKEIIKTENITGTANIGIMPIVEQVMRNSYTKGIVSFSFSASGNIYFLNVKEGESIYCLPFCPGKTETAVISFSGTEYHTAVASETAYDEDGRGVLKLRVFFPEISSSRIMKIFFEKDCIEVKMKEMPGMGLIKIAAEAAEETIKDRKTLSDIVSRIDPDIFYLKIKNTMEPDFRLYPENS